MGVSVPKNMGGGHSAGVATRCSSRSRVQYVSSPPGLHRSHSCNGPSRCPSSTRNRVSRAGPSIPLEAGVKRRRRCERVDDEPTPVAGVVTPLVGIRLRLDGTVDTDRVGDSLVLPPSGGLASLGDGWGVTESTANERLCITRPPRRRRWRPSSPGERQPTVWLNRTQYYSARERERGPREPE